MPEAKSALIAVGDQVQRTLRYTREDIALFARMTFDTNPLHVDPASAQRSRFGGIIASGQQTSAILMGMLATHFSRSDDGLKRQMVCLNMNFAFKRPIFAERDVELLWRVSNVEWNQKLGGWLGHLDGSASVATDEPSVIARGTILVSPAES